MRSLVQSARRSGGPSGHDRGAVVQSEAGAAEGGVMETRVAYEKVSISRCGPRKFHPGRKGRPGNVRFWAIHVESCELPRRCALPAALSLVAVDLIRLVALAARPRATLVAENLFLRKQLAL